MPERASPPAVKVLRTRVGLPPARIQRSESQPDKMLQPAASRYAEPPICAIVVSEKCRSRTR